MKFIEILSLFRQGKSTARSHMKNLIEVAAADGSFDDLEYKLLKKIARRNSITESQLKSIRKNPDAVTFEVPADPREKFHQLYDLVHMMIIDDAVDSEELKLCNLFAIKFGYEKARVNELIDTIKINIEVGHDPDDTASRVKWMLN